MIIVTIFRINVVIIIAFLTSKNNSLTLEENVHPNERLVIFKEIFQVFYIFASENSTHKRTHVSQFTIRNHLSLALSTGFLFQLVLKVVKSDLNQHQNLKHFMCRIQKGHSERFA